MAGKVILATASYDHTINFWEAPSEVFYRTIQYADSQINRMIISPDKTKLVVAGNPHVRFFETESTNNTFTASLESHSSNVTDVGFFPREAKWLYTCSEDKTIKLWDLRTSTKQRDYDCGAPVNTCVLHPNQTELICGLQNGTVRVWDLVASKCSLEQVPEGDVAIRSISIMSDGSAVAAANNKGHCFVWKLGEKDTSVFQPIIRISAHKAYILRTMYSMDGKYLATTSADKTVKLWKVKDGYTLFKTLKGHQRWVWDCTFSADSDYLVTASSDHVARLWKVATGETHRHYTGHRKAVSCCALSD
eukprot:TRINITY_DN23090_c0_g1_i1.p1 TRINITY_DN23090_c0_g1~~TRINITY_DN23090_c0_g1_i1.p1  ORF type:complete len:305 (-),score=47.31 TRINITY_DN23090_c0_g1_i1:664-1578(-)